LSSEPFKIAFKVICDARNMVHIDWAAAIGSGIYIFLYQECAGHIGHCVPFFRLPCRAQLLGSNASMRIRNLAGWFGIRGIGSMYYLMHAIQHGLTEDLALELLHLTLVAVALSILVHGVTVKPATSRYW
jgi:NhaP-type Na+/H+ or K+/H+ antiporter